MPNAMTDASASATPDHIGDYVAAFRVGQTLAPSAPPPPTLDQLTNAITGRLAIADSAQRDQAARRAELFGAIGMGLSNVPYAQRPSILAHIAPALANEGVPFQSVVDFDPTDEALALAVDRTQAVSRLLNGA